MERAEEYRHLEAIGKEVNKANVVWRWQDFVKGEKAQAAEGRRRS
jgi:hypothetical protein